MLILKYHYKLYLRHFEHLFLLLILKEIIRLDLVYFHQILWFFIQFILDYQYFYHYFSQFQVNVIVKIIINSLKIKSILI